jgi:hypothetical protein
MAVLVAPPSQVPIIVPPTNPAIISPPQAQLDYDLQIPLFGELPFRKELAKKGIDFIAHYISQTASNTAGIHARRRSIGTHLAGALNPLPIWRGTRSSNPLPSSSESDELPPE